MIEEKYIALINKALDGQISAEEKSKLDNYLLKNPEAKKTYDDLVMVERSLKEVPVLDPPDDLKKDIMEAIDPNLYQSKKKSGASILPFNPFIKEKSIRIIFAAAGIIIGFMLYPFLIQEQDTQYEQRQRGLSGTIGIREDFPVNIIQSIDIKVKDILGSIGLKQQDNLIWVEFNLSSEVEMSIQVTYDDQIFELISFQPLDPASLILRHQNKHIEVKTSRPFILILNQIRKQFSSVTVIVRSGTGEMQRAELLISADKN